MDYDDEEIKRKISISMALAYAVRNNVKINILDVPGFFDFEGEMVAALAAADSAIVVTSASGSLTVGTEKALDMCLEKRVPAFIFVNAVNKENSDFMSTVDAITAKYNKVVPIELPIMEGGKMTGYVDVFTGEGFSLDGKSVAALIQQYWKAIGVEMEVIEQDFATLAYTKLLPDNATKETTADSFQCYTLGFGVEADPEEYNGYFSTSTGAGSWNFIHYSNAKVDELFQQQLLLSDPEERAACFHEIAELISEDVPRIPLYTQAGLMGLSNRVQDYVCDFRGAFFQIEKWNIAE